MNRTFIAEYDEISLSMDTITLNDLDDISNELKHEVAERRKREDQFAPSAKSILKMIGNNQSIAILFIKMFLLV